MHSKGDPLSDYNHIFGERDWGDVQRKVLWNLRRIWSHKRVSDEAIEDAVASAMVDLVDYWLTLASSVTEDTDRNFRFACWRATREASKFLVETFNVRSREVSFDDDEDEDAEWGHVHGYRKVFVDESPGPEDVACEADELSSAARLLEQYSPHELSFWLRDYLEGVTEEEAARKAGITQVSMHLRRCYGKRRLHRAAVSAGLLYANG